MFFFRCNLLLIRCTVWTRSTTSIAIAYCSTTSSIWSRVKCIRIRTRTWLSRVWSIQRRNATTKPLVLRRNRRSWARHSRGPNALVDETIFGIWRSQSRWSKSRRRRRTVSQLKIHLIRSQIIQRKIKKPLPHHSTKFDVYVKE